MTSINKLALGLLLAGAMAMGGCGGDTYPDEISLEDAPRLITEAFKDEKDASVKAMAGQVSQLIKVKNYTAAHGTIAQLLSVPSLASGQRSLLSGAMMTVAENLNKAAEKGDPQAGQYLRGRSFGK